MPPKDFQAEATVPRFTAEQLAADRALVRRVLDGDAEAREAFVERMRCIPRLLTIRTRSHPLGAEELHDLSQEVFATIWRKLTDYRGEAPLEGWVHAFCVRILGSALRKMAHRSEETSLLSPNELPEREVHSADPRLEQLAQALTRLDPAQHEIVHLHGLQRLSYEEISARIHCSPRAARARYQRALARLRQLLNSEPAPIARSCDEPHA